MHILWNHIVQMANKLKKSVFELRYSRLKKQYWVDSFNFPDTKLFDLNKRLGIKLRFTNGNNAVVCSVIHKTSPRLMSRTHKINLLPYARSGCVFPPIPVFFVAFCLSRMPLQIAVICFLRHDVICALLIFRKKRKCRQLSLSRFVCK